MNPFTQKLHEGEFTRSLYYKVHGFWSGDSVRIYQTKLSKKEDWSSVVFNWSSGGRDREEESDDLVAAECFARAILNAVEVAKEWKVKP